MLPLLLFFGVVGLAGAWRRSAKGRRPFLLTIGIAGPLLLSLNAIAWALALPLEIWYEKDPLPRQSAEAIVVLSGAVHSPMPDRPYAFAAQDTYERLQHGLWLHKNWISLPILVCGGTFGEGKPYSVVMRHMLESEGIPAELIWSEDRSKSTHENAVYGSKILRERGISRIALVVEASSMPRAAASFRKAGITVVPAPIRFTKLDRSLMDVFPNWRAIALNGETLHEIIGLGWYRLRGWI